MLKRSLATITCAAALLSFGACKGGGAAADAAKLIPDAAVVIGGVDAQSFIKSPLYTDMQDVLEKDEQGEALAAAKACNLGPDTWKSVVFGFDPEGAAAGKMAVVATATGLGKKENLECIAGKVKEKNDGEAPWTLEEQDGKVVLTFSEGEGTAYAVDDNTLAIAGKDWAASVKELVDGKGKNALDNSLKEVVSRTDMKKSMWMAGSVPASMATGPSEGMKDFAMWLDVSSGLEVFAAAGVADAETATAKSTEFTEQFEQTKPMAGAFGIPQPVTDSIKIEAKDSAITVTAKASLEELKQLTAKVKEKIGS